MADQKATQPVAVLGAGSFGTALAHLLASNGYPTRLYSRSPDVVESINNTHRHPKRFGDVALPSLLLAVGSVEHACKDAVLIIHCIPAQATREFLRTNKSSFPEDVPYMSTAKGIELQSQKLMSQVHTEELGRVKNLAYLSGPSFAKEIMQGHPMSVVVASEEEHVAKFIQGIVNSLYFRVYVTTDVISVEVGGALKNPLAIAAGAARGLGFGQSTIAGLVSRGAVEMQRLAHALGGKAETLNGLSGMGDLMLTCFSSMSRNNQFGYNLSHDDLSVEEAAAKVGETVEGAATALVVLDLMNTYDLHMPLFEGIGRVLQGELKPKEALKMVMSNPPREELALVPQ